MIQQEIVSAPLVLFRLSVRPHLKTGWSWSSLRDVSRVLSVGSCSSGVAMLARSFHGLAERGSISDLGGLYRAPTYMEYFSISAFTTTLEPSH